MTAMRAPVLTITLRGSSERVHRVDTAWSPLPVERLLIGRDTAQVRAVLNATLALCRHAQTAAGAHALAAAQSADASGAADDAPHRAPVELEAARETLRRWLTDFPAAFGGRWAPDTIAQWTRLDSHARIADFCERHVFGMRAAEWLALAKPELAHWAANADTLPAGWLYGLLERAERPVSTMPAHVLRYVQQNAAALLADNDACATNSHRAGIPAHADLWNDAGTEPDLATALMTSRLRFVARLCAHDAIVAAHAAGGMRCGDIGIGWARSARGVLVHLARVDDGRVAAYRIVPPTRWNFGAASMLAHALCGLHWSAALAVAQRVALLLDPCAPYRIEVDRHA